MERHDNGIVWRATCVLVAVFQSDFDQRPEAERELEGVPGRAMLVECWSGKQLTVERLNLRPTDPLDAMSDHVKLQMSKLMGEEAGLSRSFLTWKVWVVGRKSMIEKVRQVVNRIVNLTKFKALASLRFNAELKKQARAEPKARDQQQPSAQSTTSFSRASQLSSVSDGPSMRFVGRSHPDYDDYDEFRHDTSRFHFNSPSLLVPSHSTYTSTRVLTFENIWQGSCVRAVLSDSAA